MSVRKPSIPATSMMPVDMARVLGPIKENIEMITGVRGGELTQLEETASTAEIIQAINAIIVKLNASGA